MACPSCQEPLQAGAQDCAHCGRRIAPAVPSDDDWIGTVVDGRYKVLKRLGEGGMGVVFEVEQQRLGKRAAMKVLSAELAGGARIQKQFQREAEAAARLDHPGVAGVIDFGWDRGRPYLVMELVRGVNLGDVLERDGAIASTRAASILLGIAAPVDEAHARGIVHRDLKPENVMLSRDRAGNDLVKILDFGLAKLAGKDDVTEGVVAGTPAYMAPEQIQGKPVDARADVYALACLAYRMVVGVPPFSAATAFEVVTKQIGEKPVPPSERAAGRTIGKAVDGVILGALAKDREKRPASAGAFARAFADAVGFDAWSGGRTAPPSSRAESEASSGSGSFAYKRGETALEDGLTRADVDAFDAWLERRKTWRQRLIPVGLVLAVGAVIFWQVRAGDAPRDAEVEPNEALDEATLIRPGVVKGARSTERKDVDVFRVDAPYTPGRVVRVSLVPARKDDLELALLAADGRVLASVDEGAGGMAEELPAMRLDGLAEGAFVRVQGGLGGGPGGDYAATITVEPAAAGVEVEPDDTAADAIALGVGEALAGSSYRRGDVDRIRVRGGAASVRIDLEGAPAKALRLRLKNGPPVAAPVTAALADGDPIEVVRAFDAPPGTIPYTLRLVAP